MITLQKYNIKRPAVMLLEALQAVGIEAVCIRTTKQPGRRFYIYDIQVSPDNMEAAKVVLMNSKRNG